MMIAVGRFFKFSWISAPRPWPYFNILASTHRSLRMCVLETVTNPSTGWSFASRRNLETSSFVYTLKIIASHKAKSQHLRLRKMAPN
jgi:hypothetical protein